MKRIYFESHQLKNNLTIFKHTTLTKKPAGYVIGFNWHQNIEIIYFRRGQGLVLCESISYPVKAGDIFIFNSNELHGFSTEDILEYDCLIVDSDFLSANGMDITDLYFEHHIHSAQLTSLYQALGEIIDTDVPYKEIAVRAKILELFFYLLQNHLVNAVGSVQNKNISIRLAMEYMNNHYAQRLSLEEIANAAGLSKYHFSREFKKATHTTVTSYLNMIRCNHAKTLILNNAYSVQDAAQACGFENASFFAKTFRRIMGCLPSKLS